MDLKSFPATYRPVRYTGIGLDTNDDISYEWFYKVSQFTPLYNRYAFHQGITGTNGKIIFNYGTTLNIDHLPYFMVYEYNPTTGMYMQLGTYFSKRSGFFYGIGTSIATFFAVDKVTGHPIAGGTFLLIAFA